MLYIFYLIINLFDRQMRTQEQVKQYKQEGHQKQQISNVGKASIRDEKIYNKVLDIFKKLNNQIQQMNTKVETVMEKHEGQFIHAYKYHISKIKSELQQLKKKADEQERQLRNNDRAVFMQKQSIIFRQQSLKLYERLQQKSQELQVYKFRSKDLQKTSQIMQKQIRQVLKGRKLLETNVKTLQLQVERLNRQLSQKNQQIRQLNQFIAHNNLEPKSRLVTVNSNTISSSPNRKDTTNLNLKLKQSTKISSNTKLSDLQYKSRSISYMGLNHDNQLKQWFLQCVKTIKKQIANRKYQNGPINLQNIHSISEFKMVDKLRLLEKFIENQRLLAWMYEKIFPSRINQLRQYLSQRSFQPSTQRLYTLQDMQSLNQNYYIKQLNAQKQEQKVDRHQKISVTLPKSLITKNKNSYVRNRLYIRTGQLNISGSPSLPAHSINK